MSRPAPDDGGAGAPTAQIDRKIAVFRQLPRGLNGTTRKVKPVATAPVDQMHRTVGPAVTQKSGCRGHRRSGASHRCRPRGCTGSPEAAARARALAERSSSTPSAAKASTSSPAGAGSGSRSVSWRSMNPVSRSAARKAGWEAMASRNSVFAPSPTTWVWLKRRPQPAHGGRTIVGPDDQLGDHRVVVDRDGVP